jgi:multiple antibiotic resistance protein
MLSLLEQLLQETITFAAIMDPVGVSAVMLGMLSHQATRSEVNTIARQATLTITIAFFVVLLAGDALLRAFGIDQNSLKVIGGIVLLMMALEMLGSGSGRMLSAEDREEIGVIPLGIPMIFGAGLFTTVIILKQQATSLVATGVTVVAFLINALAMYLVLRYAIHIRKLLGLTAENVITKLMGLITGAIAIQFIVSGVVVLGKGYL